MVARQPLSLSIGTAIATIVLVATKRRPMLSIVTPKPSKLLTPSRGVSSASAKTTSWTVSKPSPHPMAFSLSCEQ
jgi:hypothetical protein